ncbi:MAG: hypothetical protein DRN66_03205 [Candidatus Nanohalarchaeota archaeon]|nr:MAG: hypothetical protein DRN66_03205 [Candidatus Nanohaloarchaeota archaeon]
MTSKKVEDFMTPDLLTLCEENTIGKAIVVLREHNVSRIPILNKEGKLTSLLESIDLIKKLLTEEKFTKDAGTAIHPKYAGKISGISKSIDDSQIPVKSLANLNL